MFYKYFDMDNSVDYITSFSELSIGYSGKASTED